MMSLNCCCWTWSQSWEEMPQSALGSGCETAAPHRRLQPTPSSPTLSGSPAFSRVHTTFSLNILLIICLLFTIHLLPYHTYTRGLLFYSLVYYKNTPGTEWTLNTLWNEWVNFLVRMMSWGYGNNDWLGKCTGQKAVVIYENQSR